MVHFAFRAKILGEEEKEEKEKNSSRGTCNVTYTIYGCRKWPPLHFMMMRKYHILWENARAAAPAFL
jgi:hypothetical protein